MQAREHACRRSPLVASVGAELLRTARLPQDERARPAGRTALLGRNPTRRAVALIRAAHAGWTVHEQVVVAACDAGLHDLAATSLAALEERFPGSQRVGALRLFLRLRSRTAEFVTA